MTKCAWLKEVRHSYKLLSQSAGVSVFLLSVCVLSHRDVSLNVRSKSELSLCGQPRGQEI